MMKKNDTNKIWEAFYESWNEIDNDLEKVGDEFKSVKKEINSLSMTKDQMNKLKQSIKQSNRPTDAAFYPPKNPFENHKAKKPYGFNEDLLRPKTQVPQVVLIDEIEKFTSSTHTVEVNYKPTSSTYSEYINRKIVGMEHVEWWEYFFLYGFLKALKISYDYSKLKDVIINGKIVQKDKTLYSIEIVLSPFVQQTNVRYPEKKLYLEIPYKKITKLEEYKSGNFLYEDTYDSMDIDVEELEKKLNELFLASKLHESLYSQLKIVK